MMFEPRVLWVALWRSKNSLDGVRSHIINRGTLLPALFRTKRETKVFIDKEYGYIRTRRDLQCEPHGWKMPIPVRVKVSLSPMNNSPSKDQR